MKDWYPDKFNDDDEAKSLAETKSKTIIEEHHFSDGCSYEYFGVPKATYIKFVNAPSQARFAC